MFDRYADEPGAYPAVLDLALSNRCNLACVMCNGGLSSTIRARREGRPPLPAAYDDRFFEELDEFLPHVRRFQFKGGEPFLASENRRIWTRLLDLGLAPEVCVTTNGTVWSDEVAQFVERLRMDVILSVDAVDPERLKSIRSGVDPDRLWDNVDRFAALTSSVGARLELAVCLMAGNWDQLRGLLEEADRRDCGLSVIWVDGPARFGLLGRPADELAQVAASLDAQVTGSPPLRSDLEQIWSDVCERIRAAGTSGTTGSETARPVGEEVAVSVGRLRVEDPVDVVRDRLLQAGAAPDFAELRMEDEVFTEVSSPDWAADLALADWVGRGFDETMLLFGQQPDSIVRAQMESLEGGVHLAQVEVTAETGSSLDLLVAYVPPRPQQSTSWLIISRRAD
ncbi:MAG: radical SAM protein [Acidobacteria bacterium]|nr:radical SAM protein [Acidobacteriota bacterium]